MAQYKIRPKLGVEYKDFLTDWGVRIIEVKGAFDETPKGYYSLDFAEENGLEVYIPADRKVSNREVSIRGVYYGSDSSLYIEQMKTYLRGNGVLHFWDTHKGIEFDAVYENYETETERFRSDIEFVQFKLTFQKNINSAVDSGFLDEYTEPDLEQLKTDIINAAASAISASDNANEAASNPPIPINGYWHRYDITTNSYVNTGHPAVLDLVATYVNGYLTLTTTTY